MILADLNRLLDSGDIIHSAARIGFPFRLLKPRTTPLNLLKRLIPGILVNELFFFGSVSERRSIPVNFVPFDDWLLKFFLGLFPRDIRF
jgi:hypothetical protein